MAILVDFSLGKGMLLQFWSKKYKTSVIRVKKPNFLKIWFRECEHLASFV